MFEPTRKDGPPPEARAVDIPAIVYAARSIPEELVGRTDDEAAEAIRDLIFRWEALFTDLGREALAELTRILSDDLEDARADHNIEQVNGAFARAFLDWYGQRQEGDDPTSPKTQEFVLAAFERYLSGPEEETENLKAAETLQDFIFNNTKLRREVLDQPEAWTDNPDGFESKPIDLTSRRAKRKNGPDGPRDEAYITITPIDGPREGIEYEFDRDPVWCTLVLDAIITRYRKRYPRSTMLDLGRELTGRDDPKAIPPRYRKQIAEAVDQLINRKVKIWADNITIEGKKTSFKARGHMVDALEIEVNQGGHKVDGFLVRAEPVTSIFSRTLGEEINIPRKYINITEPVEGADPVPWPITRRRTKLIFYLAWRVILLRGDGAKSLKFVAKVERQTRKKREPASRVRAENAIQKNTTELENLSHLRLDTVYKYLGATTSREKQRVDKDVETILNSWTHFSPEWLKGYTVKTTTRKENLHSRGRSRVVKTIELEVGRPSSDEGKKSKLPTMLRGKS